jgi:hypothetical protein
MVRLWRHFAEYECGTYSPRYAAIARSVADDDDLLTLVGEAPPGGRQPNVLLAAVHYLLLGGLEHPLADVYAQRSDLSRAPTLFRDLILSQRDTISALISRRRTQTNEPGRSAVLALGLAVAARRLGEPLGLLDAGASAGLNLLVDSYRIDYGPAGCTGPPDSPVRISCAVHGRAPVPDRVPTISRRLGIDRSPVDLDDPDETRWLLACVWPDTGRMNRAKAAIDLARSSPPPIVADDMVTGLDAALDTFYPDGPVVVATTWAHAYLSPEQRQEFVAILARRSRIQPLAWLSAEGPGVVSQLPPPPAGERPDITPSIIGLVTFTGGTPRAATLGVCHPHGAWIDWTAPAGE